MFRLHWLIGFFYIFCFFYSNICLAGGCDHTDKAFNCVKLLRVHDGDTFTVDIPSIHSFFGNGMSVRVLGIDTAEITGKTDCERKLALLARQRTQEMLSKAIRIDLTEISKDKYFRLDSKVIMDSKVNLGDVLLSEGLAYKYEGDTKPKVDWCGKLSLYKKHNMVRD